VLQISKLWTFIFIIRQSRCATLENAQGKLTVNILVRNVMWTDGAGAGFDVDCGIHALRRLLEMDQLLKLISVTSYLGHHSDCRNRVNAERHKWTSIMTTVGLYAHTAVCIITTRTDKTVKTDRCLSTSEAHRLTSLQTSSMAGQRGRTTGTDSYWQ